MVEGATSTSGSVGHQAVIVVGVAVSALAVVVGVAIAIRRAQTRGRGTCQFVSVVLHAIVEVEWLHCACSNLCGWHTLPRKQLQERCRRHATVGADARSRCQ